MQSNHYIPHTGNNLKERVQGTEEMELKLAVEALLLVMTG